MRLPVWGDAAPLEPSGAGPSACCLLLAVAAAARPSAANATTAPAMLLFGALLVGAWAIDAVGPYTEQSMCFPPLKA